jgi:hypothetical protein
MCYLLAWNNINHITIIYVEHFALPEVYAGDGSTPVLRQLVVTILTYFLIFILEITGDGH